MNFTPYSLVGALYLAYAPPSYNGRGRGAYANVNRSHLFFTCPPKRVRYVYPSNLFTTVRMQALENIMIATFFVYTNSCCAHVVTSQPPQLLPGHLACK